MTTKRKIGASRLNLIAVLGLIGLFVVAILYSLSERSPESAAEEFMLALAEKDVDRVTELSYLPDPIAPVRDQWDEALNNRARHFMFTWYWEASRRQAQDSASMRLVMYEFAGLQIRETDPFEIPLIRDEGRWKVDVRSLSRNFFPAMPR